MSFDIFKQNMKLYMSNQGGIDTSDDFAKKLVQEYHMTVMRGGQTVNNVIIQKGNTDLMETLVKLAHLKLNQEQSGNHSIITEIGKGVKGYWTGATLNQVPVPIIPATGAIQNISTTSAMVSNPGTFPDMGPQLPTTNPDQLLDLLVLAMKIHLMSVSGTYMTVSLYPGFPQVPPAPGIVQWTGYTIP